MQNFQNLTSSFTPTIFSWDFYCDFTKIKNNTFKIKVALNILNSLLGEKDIENKFLEVIRNYPETREVLPILLAVREKFHLTLNNETKDIYDVSYLFDKNCSIVEKGEAKLLEFFRNSGLKEVFENKYITNLSDYVFGIETGLDSNARKNRSGTLMENIVLDFIKDFCEQKGFNYKAQATAKWIFENWGIKIESDKSKRRFDFAIFTGKKVYLFETNFYGGKDGGSKLKSVGGEFSNLYRFLQNQNIQMYWITDGQGWYKSLKSLEEAYNATSGNIYNISMLKEGILNNLIK